MKRLSKMIQSGQVPHALLLCGPKGGGKKEVAYQGALQLLETKKKVDHHPDIHLYFPEGKIGLHSIESIRNLTQDVALAPFEGRWKVFIIHDAEKMLPTSSNALLKTLEEPADQTVIMLLSDHPKRLLPTLASRCCTLFFPSQKLPDPSPELVSLLADGWNGKKLTHLDNEDADQVFETIMCWYRDRLLLELNAETQDFHFPQHREQLKKTPLVPLDTIEKRLKLIRLAHERSTKLSLCLEMFFLSC